MKILRIALAAMFAAAGVLVAVPSASSSAAPASAAPAVTSTAASFAPSTIQEVWAHTEIPAFSRGIARATCPPGTMVISSGGGGVTLDNITPGPTGGDAVVNGSAGQHSFVYAQALCAPTAQFAGTTVATVEEPRHHEPNEFSKTVRCPAGMVAFGGGGFFRAATGAVHDAGFRLKANIPARNGIGWTFTALNNSLTDRLVVTTRCAPSANLTTVVESYPIIANPGTVSGTAQGYAHCPSGSVPISGGAIINTHGRQVGTGQELYWSNAVTSGQIGWFAHGGSGGGAGPAGHTLDVRVVCTY